jgi:hypothetical protein
LLSSSTVRHPYSLNGLRVAALVCTGAALAAGADGGFNIAAMNELEIK